MELERVPPHLRRFVVRQDYAQYTEEDHAVWRFVVLQTHARLLETAHEAYRSGFDATGISVDRIPRIDEVSERLSRFGWRAVCVDGFVPPRAFQDFQAAGILPIAADIRVSRHLAYTPAPDIIHEAAGHAPFLAEPHYARYVKRIGEVARKAFGRPSERAVYDAIYALSEVKENPAATPAEVADAERALERAKAACGAPSESAKIARLYWWTAEYGLVGTPNDFRLYGAGLLSSIGEGHFCRHPNVRKLPLTAACVDVDYDITRAQPQLFVTPTLAALDDVLDEVSATLAHQVGGDAALETALESQEIATVELDSGAQIVGRVSKIHRERTGDEPFLVELLGPTAAALRDATLDGMPRLETYFLPLGTLEDGTPLSALSPGALTKHIDAHGDVRLALSSGLVIRGRLGALVPVHGHVAVALLSDFELSRGGTILFRREAQYPLVFGARVKTAGAGAVAGFFEPTAPSDTAIPKPRTFSEGQRELIGLYERALAALRGGDEHIHDEFSAITARLDTAFPDEWLLRWNLLESLVKRGEYTAVTARLEAELDLLEVRFDRLEPIATGLSYLRSLAGRHTRLSHAG